MVRPLQASIPPSSGLGGIKGFLVGKPGIKHSIYQLTGGKGRTVIRPFPEMQNGHEMPWRLGEGEYNCSKWFVSERSVAYAGIGDKFTCLTQTAGHEDDDNNSSYDSPMELFFRTLRKAIKDSPKQFYEAGVDEWLKWSDFKGPLPAIDQCGLIQGMLFESKGKPFLGPDNRTPRPMWPVILMLRGSAMRSLAAACSKEVDNFSGNPEDWDNRYTSGNPVGCGTGKLIEFNLIESQQQSGGFGKWYDAKLGVSVPLDPRLVVSAWRPWEELLHYLTEQEQINLLISRFPPEAIDFVFRGTSFYDLLGANIKGKWNQQLTHRQVPMGGGFPQGGYPGFPSQGPAVPAPVPVTPYPHGQIPGQPPFGYPPQAPVPPGYPVPTMAPVPQAPVPTIHPGSYPPNPQLSPNHTPAGQVVPVPTSIIPVAAPIQMPSGIDFGGGFQPPVTGGGGEDEVSPSVATPTYPPAGVSMAPAAPFDGGRPDMPPTPEAGAQAALPGRVQAAPMPTQPTGDPNAAVSAAAAARARLAEAQKRATEAQQPPR